MVIVLKLSPTSARDKCKTIGIDMPVITHQLEPELMEALKRAKVIGDNAKEVSIIQLQHVIKLAKVVLGPMDDATLASLEHMASHSKGPEAQRNGLISMSSRSRKAQVKGDPAPKTASVVLHQSLMMDERGTARTPGPTSFQHQSMLLPSPPPFNIRPVQPRNPLASVIPGTTHISPSSRGLLVPSPPIIRPPAYLSKDPWPTSLPTVVLGEEGLTELYGLVKPGPGIRREIKVYEDWCLAPINTERRGMYVAPVQTTSLDRAQTMILGFLGHTRKHWSLDSPGLSLDLYSDPWCIAQFISFLVVSESVLVTHDDIHVFIDTTPDHRPEE